VEIRQQMNGGTAEAIAERFRLLGEPLRIRILDRLREGPLGVGALALQLRTSKQTASKHLGLLHRAGLLTRERDGNCVRYRIADHGVFALCDDACGGIRSHLDDLESTMKEGVTR
jgi:DNA-binding transcriptional ArsR family regulator